MSASNAGRSTTGGPKVPYYRSTPIIEAAKHLRLMSGRFIADRASCGELEEAIEMFRNELTLANRAAAKEP